MTSQQQRLEELRQQAEDLAERIEQLEGQINNAQPISGLLGRWAINRHGKQVLITADRPVGGWIETAYVADNGSSCESAERLDYLPFPEQTTRPQDVPVGEAWLVNTCDGGYVKKNAVALKADRNLWVTGSADDGSAETRWGNDEVELITPLIPARPHDTPETVTTEEEYEAPPAMYSGGGGSE